MTGSLNTTSPTTLPKAEQALRAHQAMIMRRDRASYEEIAERLGYHDRASAYRAVHRYITKMATSDDVQALRQLEADGLDALQRNYLVRAKGDIAVARLVLNISARRSRLLGLDRNEQRIAGALEASAVADIAQVSMLQGALTGSSAEVVVRQCRGRDDQQPELRVHSYQEHQHHQSLADGRVRPRP